MLTQINAVSANIVPAVTLPEHLKHLIGEVRGTKAPCLQEVSVDTEMDNSQRDFNPNDVIRYISKSEGLDWNLFGYVTVVENPTTGKQTMINGQHRTSLVKTLAPQETTVPAHIISTGDPQYAAKLFAYLNGIVSRKVSPEQLLWAQILAGDDEAQEIQSQLQYCNLSCGKVNQGPNRREVSRATFVKCIKLGKEETRYAVDLIANAYPDRTEFDNLLHGLVRLLAYKDYRGLMGTLTLGTSFRDWFIKTLPDSFSYKESTVILPRSEPWQHGIAYGIYGKFKSYMVRHNKGHHCPSAETLKYAYTKGRDLDKDFE